MHDQLYTYLSLSIAGKTEHWLVCAFSPLLSTFNFLGDALSLPATFHSFIRLSSSKSCLCLIGISYKQ